MKGILHKRHEVPLTAKKRYTSMPVAHRCRTPPEVTPCCGEPLPPLPPPTVKPKLHKGTESANETLACVTFSVQLSDCLSASGRHTSCCPTHTQQDENAPQS